MAKAALTKGQRAAKHAQEMKAKGEMRSIDPNRNTGGGNERIPGSAANRRRLASQNDPKPAKKTVSGRRRRFRL